MSVYTFSNRRFTLFPPQPPTASADDDEISAAEEKALVTKWEQSAHDEWRGYDIVVSALLDTAKYHQV